jgi:hypothetical protein
MAIDVWIQHPTPRFLGHEAFESLRRWTGLEIPAEEVPLETTLAALDAAVSRAPPSRPETTRRPRW